MTAILTVLSLIGLVLAVMGVLLLFTATGDAEGCLMGLRPWGKWLLIVGLVLFIGCGLWALVRTVGVYPIAAAVLALYVWGCVDANARIRHSTKEYDRRILVKGTLMSRYGVLLMDWD